MVDVKRQLNDQGFKRNISICFIVELDQDKHNFERVSYTYTDVLTENVQVSFEEDNHQEAVALTKNIIYERRR